MIEDAGEVFNVEMIGSEIKIQIKLDIAKTNFKKLIKFADSYDYSTRTFTYKTKMIEDCKVTESKILMGFGDKEHEDTLYTVENSVELLSDDFAEVDAVIFADYELGDIIKRAGKAKKSKPRTTTRKKVATPMSREIAQEMLDDGVAMSEDDIKHLSAVDRHTARMLNR